MRSGDSKPGNTTIPNLRDTGLEARSGSLILVSLVFAALIGLSGCGNPSREVPAGFHQVKRCPEQGSLTTQDNTAAHQFMLAAEACLNQSQYTAAEHWAAQAVAGKSDNASHAERALYLHALATHQVWQHGGRSDEQQARAAIGRFAKLMSAYPESSQSERVRDLVLDLRNGMAEQELVALQRAQEAGRDKEVTARADYILRHYQHSPAAPKALAAQVTALERMGQTQQADTKRQLLQNRWPNH